MSVTKLSVSVEHVQGFGKCKVASQVKILLGDLVVASSTLGGKYTNAQVISEFRKNPDCFQKGEAFAAHALPFA